MSFFLKWKRNVFLYLFKFNSNYNEIHLEILQSAFINTKICESSGHQIHCVAKKKWAKKNVKTQTQWSITKAMVGYEAVEYLSITNTIVLAEGWMLNNNEQSIVMRQMCIGHVRLFTNDNIACDDRLVLECFEDLQFRNGTGLFSRLSLFYSVNRKLSLNASNK